MVRKFQLTFLLVLTCAILGYGQKVKWNAGLYSFFDNIEFGQSAVKIPQTMAGVQFMPGIVIVKDTIHNLSLGLNLIHEFGSGRAVDFLYPTAYYKLDYKKVKFIMGAFPRTEIPGEYPRLFFQDSVSYYRPNINGVFLGVSDKKNYLNIWLDWTGRMSESVHEAFFLSMSGRYNAGPFYAKHYSYMYHFASVKDPVINEALHDNLLLLTSVGVDFSDRTIFTRLEANAGLVAGVERARADNTGWISLSGLLSEARVEYKFIGLFNTFYKGSGLMRFYDDHGTDLYWGDPVFRAGTYDRADLFLRFYNSDLVDIEVTYSLHFLESRIYHEQLLKVKLNLNSK